MCACERACTHRRETGPVRRVVTSWPAVGGAREEIRRGEEGFSAAPLHGCICMQSRKAERRPASCCPRPSESVHAAATRCVRGIGRTYLICCSRRSIDLMHACIFVSERPVMRIEQWNEGDCCITTVVYMVVYCCCWWVDRCVMDFLYGYWQG